MNVPPDNGKEREPEGTKIMAGVPSNPAAPHVRLDLQIADWLRRNMPKQPQSEVKK